LYISTIQIVNTQYQCFRIVDIDNSNYGYQQFQLVIYPQLL